METKRIGVPKEETKLVLRSYAEHPANWVVILKEVRENSHLLPQNVQQLYATGSAIKLRRRMSDQVHKLFTLSDEKLNEEELVIQDLVQKIKAERQETSRKIHPSSRKRKQTGRSTNAEKSVSVVSKVNTQEQPGGIGNNRRDNIDTDDRQNFVNVSDSSSGNESPIPGPSQRKKSNAELSREANLEYLKFARESLPKLMSKMDKCMDKFLEN